MLIAYIVGLKNERILYNSRTNMVSKIKGNKWKVF